MPYKKSKRKENCNNETIKHQNMLENLNESGDISTADAFRLELETQLAQRDELRALRIQQARIANALENI
jgi:phosphoribosylformylglycinamidine (FGAM) synthase PurS component